MSSHGHLYFHKLCFDGIASAVLAIDVLGWIDPELHAVGYEQRATWLGTPRGEPCAIVDFLFHPQARLWADHHPTTFVTESAAEVYNTRNDGSWFHDPAMDSCAALLLARFPRLRDHELLVRWANKIDGARYESVNEALFGESPALVISKGLAVATDRDCIDLVNRLRTRSLEAVAADGDVRERFAAVQRETNDALRRLEAHASLLTGGIVVADLSGEPSAGSRYAPYHRYPNALYSVVLYRAGEGSKITAMRNPWREFQSVPLGEIFKRYGGGGHRRVASVLIPSERAPNASAMLGSIAHDIQCAMRVSA